MSSRNFTISDLSAASICVAVAYVIAAFWYIGWRVTVFNPDALIFSTILYAVECFGLITVLLQIMMTARLTNRAPPPPLTGTTVDVFIPTINEPVEIVRRTVLAAVNMDFPHKIWILDDGNRPEIAAIATGLGVNYIARNNNTDAKAGNLNSGLAQSSGELIAIFDCDHAPRFNFLTQTLGYFRDPNVAFVQTPQDFYNLDSFQHRRTPGKKVVWMEQSVFFRVIQRGKDFWNAAFFCGSCAVIRREALNRIGGFATGTVTEDLHTSLKLHKQGYASVYHAESLAFGIAPSTIEPFLRQRVRWGQGAMQVWRQEGILFSKGLTIAQRLNYLASVITYFDGWQKAIYYITPVIVLITGIMPLRVSGTEFLIHFLPFFLLSYVLFEELSRGYGRSLLVEQYNMARFLAVAYSTLFFFKKELPFRVTQKATDPLLRRAMTLTPQLFVLFINILAIVVGSALFYRNAHLTPAGFSANLVWAIINSLIAIGVVRFAIKGSQFERSDYRFPLPLVAQFGREDGCAIEHATLDNISSSGCRIYGKFDLSIALGTIISGRIALPGSALPFRAKVTALFEGLHQGQRYVKAIGCAFIWDSVYHKDALELFLYGSDLQWVLGDIRENVPTPIERVVGLFRKTKPSRLAAAHWSTMLYTSKNTDAPLVGLIGVTNDGSSTHRVILFEKHTSSEISARLLSRAQSKLTNYQISDLKQTESGTGPLFVGVAKAIETRSASEEPSAYSSAGAITASHHEA